MVKAHATIEDVENGITIAEDRIGNGYADVWATMGINEHFSTVALRDAFDWLALRHDDYGKFIN